MSGTMFVTTGNGIGRSSGYTNRRLLPVSLFREKSGTLQLSTFATVSLRERPNRCAALSDETSQSATFDARFGKCRGQHLAGRTFCFVTSLPTGNEHGAWAWLPLAMARTHTNRGRTGRKFPPAGRLRRPG